MTDSRTSIVRHSASKPTSRERLHSLVHAALNRLPSHAGLGPEDVEIHAGPHGTWFASCSVPCMTHEEEAASVVVARLQAQYHLDP